MTIEEAIRAKVIGDTAIAALLGRRYRPELPNDADEFPCIVYSKEDDEPRVTMAGRIGLTHAVLSLECWANTYDEAKSLRTRVKNLLHPLREKVNDLPIRLATVNEGSDQLEAAIGMERARKFGCELNIPVWYQELA